MEKSPKPRKGKQPRLDFWRWTAELRERLEEDGEARGAISRLQNDGCELLSVCYLLWDYCGRQGQDRLPEGLADLRSRAQKAELLSKELQRLAVKVAAANEWIDEQAIQRKGAEDFLFCAYRARTELPERLQSYAFFLSAGLAKSLRKFTSKRRWGYTDRLVLAAMYVNRATGKKHYADLTHLLHAAYAAFGYETERDESFIRNTCLQFPRVNPLVYRVLERSCAEYLSLPPTERDKLPFVLWLQESKRVLRT